MQVVIHAGAHNTDDDRLVNCLTENREILAKHGASAPAPSEYRRLIRDIMHQAQESELSADARDVVVDAISREGVVDRLILSNPGFFGIPKMAVGGGCFYPAAELRLDLFSRIFPDDEIELFLAIRNPATFLPSLLEKSPINAMDDLLRGTDPTHMRWSEMLARIRNSHPDIPITVWCNEDTPLIWSQVVHEAADIDPKVEFSGEFSLLMEIMTRTGQQRFKAYMESHPGMTEMQKRRVITAFLTKFADEDAIEEELDVPGWTAELIEALTEMYDDDVYEIERIHGVRMIMP